MIAEKVVSKEITHTHTHTVWGWTGNEGMEGRGESSLGKQSGNIHMDYSGLTGSLTESSTTHKHPAKKRQNITTQQPTTNKHVGSAKQTII